MCMHATQYTQKEKSWSLWKLQSIQYDDGNARYETIQAFCGLPYAPERIYNENNFIYYFNGMYMHI